MKRGAFLGGGGQDEPFPGSGSRRIGGTRDDPFSGGIYGPPVPRPGEGGRARPLFPDHPITNPPPIPPLDFPADPQACVFAQDLANQLEQCLIGARSELNRLENELFCLRNLIGSAVDPQCANTSASAADAMVIRVRDQISLAENKLSFAITLIGSSDCQLAEQEALAGLAACHRAEADLQYLSGDIAQLRFCIGPVAAGC